MGHYCRAGGAEGLVEAGGEVGQVVAPVQAHLALPQLRAQLSTQSLLHLAPGPDIVEQPDQQTRQNLTQCACVDQIFPQNSFVLFSLESFWLRIDSLR